MIKNIKTFIYNTILVGSFLLGICSISGFADGSANVFLCLGVLCASFCAGVYAFNAEKLLRVQSAKPRAKPVQFEIKTSSNTHIEIAG